MLLAASPWLLADAASSTLAGQANAIQNGVLSRYDTKPIKDQVCTLVELRAASS